MRTQLPALASQPCVAGQSRTRSPAMNIKQARQIEVGATLPVASVELVKDECAAFDECPVIDTYGDLSAGKQVIIGMPGAFTPTCTSEHLPGYIRNSKKFRQAGATVNVVTTNDVFIMTAWKRAMKKCMQEEGLTTLDSEVNMLADKGGDLIKALGLGYYMTPAKDAAWSFQLNSGLRSKRFALIAENGVVTHVAVDEGDTEMIDTSAEAILQVLSPRNKAKVTKGGASPSAAASSPSAAAASASVSETSAAGADAAGGEVQGAAILVAGLLGAAAYAYATGIQLPF